MLRMDVGFYVALMSVSLVVGSMSLWLTRNNFRSSSSGCDHVFAVMRRPLCMEPHVDRLQAKSVKQSLQVRGFLYITRIPITTDVSPTQILV